ncbi:MAG: DUF2207 domain-containing protein [Dermatophilaceae bacterium]|mgnify:FL=1
MRRLVRVLLLLTAVVWMGTIGTTAASADSGDTIKDYRITYTIRTDGSIAVVEDIDYAFAATDRHGIYRTLITRQPFSPTSERDVVYGITGLAITSPDASAKFEKHVRWSGFRMSWLEAKVGDAKKEITSRRARYHLTYTLTGALRTTDGKPDFYWNATGNDWKAAIAKLHIEVRAPAAADKVVCYQGLARATTRCDGAKTKTLATFDAHGLTDGEGVTISALYPAGSIAHATPTILPKGSLLTNAHVTPVTIGAAALALLAGLVASAAARFGRRDRRYAATPPGVLAPPGTAWVKDSMRAGSIPVQFDPPDVPPALGGTLLDRDAAQRRTAAVLVELAAQGVIAIRADPASPGSTRKRKGATLIRSAVIRDLERARPGYQQAFVNAAFGYTTQPLILDADNSADSQRFRQADEAVTKVLDRGATTQGWYAGTSSRPVWLALLVILAAGFVLVRAILPMGQAGWIWLAPAALVAALLLHAASRWTRGYRTPVGRALTDQMIGFRRYLSTAEAGQLRFEEGVDIFSKYLPWAIMFDVADRWQRVCAELAAAGRIPASPEWYDDNRNDGFYSSYSSGDFGSSLVSASVSSAESSGSSGGGSSGGGGGGGGGGSW